MAKQYAIDHAEYRRVSANAERQRHHGNRGKSGTLYQLLESIAKILKKSVHLTPTRTAEQPWDRPWPRAAPEYNWQGLLRRPITESIKQRSPHRSSQPRTTDFAASEWSAEQRSSRRPAPSRRYGRSFASPYFGYPGHPRPKPFEFQSRELSGSRCRP